MTDEEQSILNFLQSSPQSFFARKEIARKAMGRKVYEENQNWANTPLDSLVGQGKVEQNDSGQFRIYGVDV
jgi:hypothetical protein